MNLQKLQPRGQGILHQPTATGRESE